MDDEELARRIRVSVAHLGLDHPASPPVHSRARRSPYRTANLVKLAAVFAVLVMIAVGALVVAGSGRDVSAVTPGVLRFDPVDEEPAALFERAAAAALEEGGAAPGSGEALYVLSEAWFLDTVVGEDGGTDVSLRSTVEETWVDAGGRGVRQVWPGRELEPGEVGDAFVPPDWSTTPDARFDEVVIGAGVASRVPDDPGPTVSLDTLGWADDGGDVDAQLFRAVAGLLLDAPLGPAQRSVLWSTLAEIDGVDVLGSTTDRAGREGVGVATTTDITGIETRWMLVFDPDTGRALALEAVMVGDTRDLDIPTPALSEFTVVVESTIVDGVGERPES